MKYRIVATITIIAILSVLIVAAPPSRSAKFFLSEWDFPDEYGQGIESLIIYQNVSGVWTALDPSGVNHTDELNIYNISEGQYASIRVVVKCLLNKTLVNVSSLSEGMNYIRHNGVLLHHNLPIITLENFTYWTGTTVDDPIYTYFYNATFVFSPIGGLSYMALIDCEIYW